MARVLLNMPKTAKPGDIVEVKLLISHPMESGQRKDENGQTVPRNIIHEFRCVYNGAEVLHLDLYPAMAANPYLAFSFRAEQSGSVEMSWIDDQGIAGSESAVLQVG
jgi:sulfur-oxidizing protein SoxZ